MTGLIATRTVTGLPARGDEFIPYPKPLNQAWCRMNWTSTQHLGWVEKCQELAGRQQPFRLDHVAGALEKAFCVEFCAKHEYRQKSLGSSVLFSPEADK